MQNYEKILIETKITQKFLHIKRARGHERSENMLGDAIGRHARSESAYYLMGVVLGVGLVFNPPAPKSQEDRKGEERRIALIMRQRAMTMAEINKPMVNMAMILLPGPVERNPFMKLRFGMKK